MLLLLCFGLLNILYLAGCFRLMMQVYYYWKASDSEGDSIDLPSYTCEQSTHHENVKVSEQIWSVMVIMENFPHHEQSGITQPCLYASRRRHNSGNRPRREAWTYLRQWPSQSYAST